MDESAHHEQGAHQYAVNFLRHGKRPLPSALPPAPNLRSAFLNLIAIIRVDFNCARMISRPKFGRLPRFRPIPDQRTARRPSANGETGMNLLIGVLITFLVVILVLYLVNMLPLDGRAKQIVRVIVIVIGVLSLLRYLGVAAWP
jgi:hypothetical protein